MPTHDAPSRELAFAPRLRPGERFSHLSAARLWDMPLPLNVDERVHVSAPLGAVQLERRGVVSHRRGGGQTRIRRVAVSTPVETFIELSTVLDHEDLVAIGDWLVLNPRRRAAGDRRPHASPEGLRESMNSRRAWGIVAARRAANRVRPGVESRTETLLRLLLEDAGFPPPACGMAIGDRHGRFIGYFDMVWPDQHVIVEYDGDQHRTDTRQYEKDILRFDRASAAGWRVVRVRAHGLGFAGRRDTLSRVAEAFALQEIAGFPPGFTRIPRPDPAISR